MNIRISNDNDVDSNLLKLYIKGFKMHYENRKDIFIAKTDEELKNELIDVLKNPERIVLVIEIENAIIGYVEFKYTTKATKCILIDQIFIDNDCKRKGYGRMLIEEVTKFAKKNNCKRIELNCWSFNEDALKFYQKIGFIPQRIIFEKPVQ